MAVPNDSTGTRVQGVRNGVAHAEVSIVDREARVSGIAFHNEIPKELCGIGVGDECLHLENDLDDAVEDRKDEVDLREPGEGDAIPLCKTRSAMLFPEWHWNGTGGGLRDWRRCNGHLIIIWTG